MRTILPENSEPTIPANSIMPKEIEKICVLSVLVELRIKNGPLATRKNENEIPAKIEKPISNPSISMLVIKKVNTDRRMAPVIKTCVHWRHSQKALSLLSD
jgi:hypothetical protein